MRFQPTALHTGPAVNPRGISRETATFVGRFEHGVLLAATPLRSIRVQLNKKKRVKKIVHQVIVNLSRLFSLSG